MTRDDILKLAGECGAWPAAVYTLDNEMLPSPLQFPEAALIRFATEIRARVLEDAVQVCEALTPPTGPLGDSYRSAQWQCAQKIRQMI